MSNKVTLAQSSKPGGKAFGQREPLTVRLRGLIRNYPKGVGIFQEFIQNADDAGASWVKIVLDLRQFGGDHLPAPQMAGLMGPALLICNDQVFSLQDLESIQQIGLGGKGQDLAKTGRFGLGFNACYNVTDYPSFLTGSGIYFFDPHHNTVSGATVDNPGQMWELGPGEWDAYHELFRPFDILGLKQGAPHFGGTIFRLPLRTAEQASSSEISQEPFTEADFDSTVDQLAQIGDQILIFLKHVVRISVFKIGGVKGAMHRLLDISTINSSEVTANREKVNRFLQADPGQLLHHLRGGASELPVVSFQHKVQVQTPTSRKKHAWRLVSGVFVDDNHAIADQVEKMHHLGEKAVPWAGAAAKLDLGKPKNPRVLSAELDGRLFCFLPLHISTGLPVHLNGFFDLDSSRQTLTTNHKTLSGKDATRAEWNTLLAEHGVAQAYATLLADLVDDVGRSDPKTYYSYWPSPDTGLPDALNGLTAAVYRRLAAADVLHSADPQNEWCSVGSLSFIPPLWQNELQEPLVADRMRVPVPALPEHIAKGFHVAGIPHYEITPSQIRARLRTGDDVDCPIAQAERLCLRRRKWIVALLKFCLLDKPAADLVGVPLLLLCDGRLHTFGTLKLELAFLAGALEREIFAKFPYWFVDPLFASDCGLQPIPGAKLFDMNTASVIARLGRCVAAFDSDDGIGWDPEDSDTPNTSWLRLVYQYLAQHANDIGQSADALKQVPLAPDQFGRLWRFSRASTPLRQNPRLPAELAAALDKMGIPVVTGTPELLSAIDEFCAKTSGYIWDFTAQDFADVLCAFSDDWHEQYPSYTQAVFVPILDFLSSPNAVASLRQFPNTVSELCKLHLLPTVDARLESAQNPDLFMAANFDLPPFAGNLPLLYSGPDGRWKPLFRLLKIKELDRPTLIRKVLLPRFAEFSDPEQVAALAWIRDHLAMAEAEHAKITGGNGAKIADLVSEAPLVRGTDGRNHPCRCLYDPQHTEVIKAVLGDVAVFLSMEMYQDDDRWLKFFRSDLALATTPRASAILDAVDRLIARGQATSSVSARLRKIYEYLTLPDNWTRISQEKISDPKQPASPPRQLATILSERAWLPAQCDPEKLARYAAACTPDARLYKPRDLYTPQVAHLVASQKPIAAVRQPERQVIQSLGFVHEPQLTVVLAHFDAILAKWSLGDHGGIEEESLVKSIYEIYRYLASQSGKFNVQDLKKRYADRPCLWHPQTHTFYKPSHVFKDAASFLNPWRIRVTSNDAQMDQGYSLLGRLERPGYEQLVELLKDLRARFGELALEDQDTRKVMLILRLLSTLLPGEKAQSTFPILTKANKLVDSAIVYIDDASWLQNHLSPEAVHLLNNAVPYELIQFLDVKSLSRHITERAASRPIRSDNRELQRDCAGLQQLVRSREFYAGLVRLVQDQHSSIRVGELKWLQQTTICPVQTITVEYWLQVPGGSERLVGSGPTTNFYDPSQQTIYLAQGRREVIFRALATAVNSQLDHLALSDLSILLDVLRSSPSEIDSLLTELHVRLLPDTIVDEFDQSEEAVDFAVNYEVDEDPETDLLPDEEPVSTSERPHSAIRPPQLTPGAGKDVPPPTKPGTGKSPAAGNGGSGEHNDPHPQSKDKGANEPGTHSTAPSGNTRVFPAGVFARDAQEPDRDSETRLEDIETGNRAVDRVVAAETGQGYTAKRMPHNHKGYDVEVYDGATLIKYIEVKGIRSAWGTGGVSISKAQYLWGWENRDKFWLYVVENALDDESYRIYKLRDPIDSITHYRFDNGWSVLAETSPDAPRKPEAGMYVHSKANQTVGVIEEVQGEGSAITLIVRYGNGQPQRVLFRPSQMELTPAHEG